MSRHRREAEQTEKWRRHLEKAADTPPPAPPRACGVCGRPGQLDAFQRCLDCWIAATAVTGRSQYARPRHTR
jgi:hypothetical protein